MASGARRTLDRILSRLGICSRTEARTWIEAGRMKVDGRVQRDPDRWVDPETAELTLDDLPLRSSRKIYLALHKPRGVLTSHGDPRGRATVHDLLKGFPSWVAAVGRLDLLTSPHYSRVALRDRVKVVSGKELCRP